MTLKSKSLAALVVAMMFGGILFSGAMGWWQTESTKKAAVFTEGDFAGQANPADIRGSYTFGDIEKNFNLPATILAEAFAVETGDPAAFPVKDLETLYAGSEGEIGTASVRLFTAFYLGLPFDLSGEVYLPESAAVLLLTRDLGPEQAAYLQAHTSPNPAPGAAPQPVPAESLPSENTPDPASTAAPAGAESTPAAGADRTVKGKTTFVELLEWGLTPDIIQKVLGAPAPSAPGVTVKDFCTEAGLSFETVKPALQAEVDRLP